MDCARNIITAAFSAGKTETTTAPLWQWDYGQTLCITGIEDLPAAFEVHFSTNKTGGVSTVAVGADGQVTIPNELLTIGKNLNAWIYLSDAQGEGETEYSILIPVKARPMPETYDAEVTGEFDDVVRQVSEYAQTAQTAADNAGASATAAATSASEAAASASAAETAKTAAETAQGKAEDAQAAAETAAQTATEKAQQTAQDAAQAALDAGRAESAAERAESAETGAGAAKTAAEAAAQGAAASAATATEKATRAGQSATAAAGSASAAAQSAASIEGDVQTATEKAAEASASASAAAASETAAQTAQTAAEAAETNAGQSATTATTKAAEAAQSASGAAQSKTAAEAAATRAETAAASLTVDSALSDTSVNPVQNKVITGEVAQLKSAISEDEDDYVLMPGFIDGNGNQSNITSTSGSYELISEFIPVRPGDVFTFTMTQTSEVSKWMAICQYDANFSMVGTRTTQSPRVNIFTFDYHISNTDARYIRYSYRSYGGTVTMKVKRTVTNDLAMLDKNVDASGILVYDATPFSLTHGGLTTVDASTDTPVINGGQKYRVCMTKPVEFSAPVSISAKPGFRAFFYSKSPNGTEYSRDGWRAISHSIDKNTKFIFFIARVEEDASEVADIAEFASAITFSLPTLNVCDAINDLKDRTLSDENISKINRAYDYPGLTPLILAQDNGFVNVVINADTAYIQIPGDTLAVTANGYIQIAANTETIDISTNAIATSAIKVLYNTVSNTFMLKAYNGIITADEILIATVRRNVNNPSISIACPYTLNRSPYGIVSDVDYDKVVKGVNHRGYNTAPENTLPAFKLSKEKGFNYVETDVAFTSDGVPVLLHDSTINRTARNTDGTEISETVSIGSITYEQALTYDFGIYKGAMYAGTKIPTLEQFMSLCRALGLHPYIELKSGTEAQIQGCVDIVKKYGMRDKVSWISFDATRLGYVKDYDSSARLGYIFYEITATAITTAQGLKTTDNEVFIDAIYSMITDENVALCIAANIPLETWTINTENVVTALNPYVSGMTSDSLIAGKVLYQANI